MRYLPLLVVALGACGGGSKPASGGGGSRMEALAAESGGQTAAPSPRPSGPKTLEGTFRSKHVVMVVCDKPDWCETEVEDVLVVEPAQDGAIAVKIELVQANAHSCTFENTARRVGERAWQWTAPKGEPACVLDISWSYEQVKIESEGCRDFCGARATLHATFDTKTDR